MQQKKANKNHECNWCPELILAKTHYCSESGILPGVGWQTNKLHEECLEVWNKQNAFANEKIPEGYHCEEYEVAYPERTERKRGVLPKINCIVFRLISKDYNEGFDRRTYVWINEQVPENYGAMFKKKDSFVIMHDSGFLDDFEKENGRVSGAAIATGC